VCPPGILLYNSRQTDLFSHTATPRSYTISRRHDNNKAAMDGQVAQAPTNQQVPPQQQPSLIRTDQVAKLPHLTDAQKSQHTQLVRSLWDVLNSREPSSDEYRNAQVRLMQVSQSLMKGMQLFRNKIQQQQQQQAQPQPPPPPPPPPQQQPVQPPAQNTQPAQSNSNPATFSQLLPAIQAKVNSIQFQLPPTSTREQAANWLTEAKLRYGMALQKQEIGRQRSLEVRQQVQARQSSGAGPAISPEEMAAFRTRQVQAEKLFREGQEFLKKFQEQQESFRATRAGAQGAAVPPSGQQQGINQNISTTATPASTSTPVHPGQPPAPAPHTVNSAVNAARVQAGQGQANAASSAQMVQGQTAAAQGQGQTPTTTPVTQPLAQQAQATTQPDGTTMLQGQAPNSQPRPLSHEAAISQAAKSYQGNNQQPPQQQAGTPQAAAASHAHPPGYMQNRSTENTTRNHNMAIPKNLNIQPPEPVAMGTPRPTLSGGPSHGAVGVMGQPAIQKHPGYVLEGEGQRVLSKKMLDILVRQVTGGGEGEGLTPDAEEVSPPTQIQLRWSTFLQVNHN
jgi:transcription initiation factor TFIID subunit 12